MSMSDKGDMQNVQSSGSRGTGLKTTGLDEWNMVYFMALNKTAAFDKNDFNPWYLKILLI